MKSLFFVSFAVPAILYAAGVEPKVIYEEDPTLLTSNFRIVVQTGAASDPMNKVGMSNLMAELLLRGTKKMSRTQFQSSLEQMGGSLGVATSHDTLTFYGSVIRENTEKLITLIEEFLLHPKMDKKEFDNLKRELTAEVSYLKNNNGRLGGLAIRREMFAGTPLEKPTHGTLSTLKAIQLEDVVRAYNNQFHRGNILFGVASSRKEADVKTALTKIWLKFPDGAHVNTKPILPRGAKKPTLLVVHKPKSASGSLYFGAPGIVANDPDRYRLGVANFVFGGDAFVSRLFKVVREEKGWTYSIFSTYNATGILTRQPGLFLVGATPSVEFTGKTIFATMELWKELLDKGITGEELKLSRESIVNSYPFEFDSPHKRVSERIQAYLYDVPILTPEEYEKTLTGVGNSHIREALKRHHDAKDLWVVVVADKDVVAKQLEEEQANIPADQRLTISKVLTPDQIVD